MKELIKPSNLHNLKQIFIRFFKTFSNIYNNLNYNAYLSIFSKNIEEYKRIFINDYEDFNNEFVELLGDNAMNIYMTIDERYEKLNIVVN